MYKIIEYNDKIKNRWDEFAIENGSIFHTIAWKEVLEKTFGYKACYYFVINASEEIKGILPIVCGKGLNLKKSGVSLPFANYVDFCYSEPAVKDFICSQIEHIRIKNQLDYVELRVKEGLTVDSESVNNSNYSFVLSLDGDEDTILSRSSSSNRNHTRKAYKNGLFDMVIDFNKINEFYEVWAIRQKQLGSPAPGIEFFKNIYDKFKENTVLITVTDRQSSKTVGGMLILLWKDTMYYMWGGNYVEYNNKYLNNFMYWEAVKYGINKGYKLLDLGRSPKNSGTFKFKSQFGANAIQLKYLRVGRGYNGGSWSNEKEKLAPLIAAWKITPSFLTGYIGKKIIKYVKP